ncbi:hypothetical protein [Streptomyces sp. NPDC058486]|uniref:hypothetical protein n=1 Tax=unclassified Streptomyces TaxID=2593676 RepID=UPI00364796F3
MLLNTEDFIHRLYRDQLVPAPQLRADAADHHADILERLVREGTAPADAAEWIAKDRARA